MSGASADIVGRGPCEICKHAFDPHVLFSTSEGGPEDGGIMLCPEKGCECFSTWGYERNPARVIPTADEIQKLRQMVQAPLTQKDS